MAGRGVLVVGSSSEIGLAIARAFAVDGDRVVGVALDRHDPADHHARIRGARLTQEHQRSKTLTPSRFGG